jgi:oxygen-independent coproporphyrinogen-3 oxidase
MVGQIERLLAAGGPFPSVETLYIGGGTPSLMPEAGPGSLESLLDTARRSAPSLGEITVEANPESLGKAFLRTAVDAGVGRLSVGVQSLDPETRRGLGRQGRTSRGELEEIRAAWPGSLSVDLIHAAPGSTRESEVQTLREVIDAGADHISIYDLGVETGTRLAARVSPDSLPDSGAWWRDLTALLADEGFERYEVSNFARPGHRSRHNMHYWSGDEYLGVGPGAVSTVARDGSLQRVTQTTDHSTFLAQNELLRGTVETLSEREIAAERLMLGLRMRAGVSEAELHQIADVFGPGAREALDGTAAKLAAGGLLELTPHGIAPTDRGLDLLNVVIRDLLVALDHVD